MAAVRGWFSMHDEAGIWAMVFGIGPVIVLTAMAVSAVLIAALRPLLLRHALAQPNARSSHREPTPQGAGVAVVAGTLCAVAIALALLPPLQPSVLAGLAAVGLAAVLLMAVGLVDDLRGVPIGVRVALQTLSVGAAVFSLPSGGLLEAWIPVEIERAILILAGLWFVNLVNFMDGIDWITIAECLPLAAGLVLLGLLGALPLHGVVAALALLGALIGFAPFNRPPARIFLGDAGSLPIGLITGWLLLQLAAAGHVAAALLLPLYYLADATLTLLRRLLAGETVWQAHRSHFYQRATDNGFSVLAIDVRIFLLNLFLIALACVSVLAGRGTVDAAALALGAGAVGFVLFSFSRGPR
jgi:UDP-N-acetylmuramyl pentapeptide phosphotransferase/UDP-N-acetylglucosamine-1-phosphate transferase